MDRDVLKKCDRKSVRPCDLSIQFQSILGMGEGEDASVLIRGCENLRV